ncbi:hypothetical protein C2U35_13740 [Ralstonia solanacearum]|nr:hypothetical protein C2U35_13740 [Ralstonia solanacearum]
MRHPRHAGPDRPHHRHRHARACVRARPAAGRRAPLRAVVRCHAARLSRAAGRARPVAWRADPAELPGCRQQLPAGRAPAGPAAPARRGRDRPRRARALPGAAERRGHRRHPAESDRRARSAAARPGVASAAASLHALGWHVELHTQAHRLPALLPPLLEAQVDVVVDHFGRPDPTLGVEDPGFAALLAAGRTRRVWVKVSGAYRNGDAGRGEAIALAAMPRLKDALGTDRLAWGSDWPHTQYESRIGYDSARAFADTLLPDAGDRHQVLVETPARLFRFA